MYHEIELVESHLTTIRLLEPPISLNKSLLVIQTLQWLILNFENLEHHHYQANRKSNIIDVLAKEDHNFTIIIYSNLKQTPPFLSPLIEKESLSPWKKINSFYFVLFLCQDYHWWWRSFFMSGSCSIYVFFYATFYFVTKVSFLTFTPSRFI